MVRGRAAAIAILGLTACQTPWLVFSGGELSGTEAAADSFAFADRYRFLQLEVGRRDPYSVNLRVVTRDGRLYLDAAERRRWHTLLKQNPNVRIKLGGKIYPARAVRIEDPTITRQFLPERTIYELVPRAPPEEDDGTGRATTR